MRSPLTALAALPILAAPLLALPSASAATCTAPELVNATVTPRTVVLGTSQPKGVEITVAVREHGCAVSHVDTDVFTATDFVDTLAMEEVGTSGGVTTYVAGARINPGAFPNSDAGTFRTSVYVRWGKKVVSDDGPTFRLLRAARLTANASPEPVRRGKPVTVAGTLTRANWETLRYAGYTGRDVRLQFKPAGGAWATVGTATSSGGGKLATTVEAGRDGCFRYVFPGSSTTAKAVSATDCVDVR
ncbi:hypothetical protein SAMN04488543_3351 [Friedmanniella luteola]|uniref:Secreted protein n=1 Tax=Friedmanniella luteola TaxID=546871 RepID=A0A1H1YMA8_9ACTN|nr:hypothetical protein [Friedmanniella luteola]SDT22399.1 hypothetical protein SAMN04488543_3351 [Friedmanniella luteola]